MLMMSYTNSLAVPCQQLKERWVNWKEATEECPFASQDLKVGQYQVLEKEAPRCVAALGKPLRISLQQTYQFQDVGPWLQSKPRTQPMGYKPKFSRGNQTSVRIYTFLCKDLQFKCNTLRAYPSKSLEPFSRVLLQPVLFNNRDFGLPSRQHKKD